MRGWTESAGVEPEAAAGARVGAGLVMWLANKLVATLALLHGSLRVQRTHAQGRLVTGGPNLKPSAVSASPAAQRQRV